MLARMGAEVPPIMTSLIVGRTNDGNHLSLVAPVNPKILSIHRNNAVPREQFAHANQAEVGKIRMAICVSGGQSLEVRNMVIAAEADINKSFTYHGEHKGNALQMKCRLRQHWFAGQQRFSHKFRHCERPIVIGVGSVGESDEKAGVRNAPHDFENPLRLDKSFGPRTEPASRINARFASAALAFSICSRISWPWDMPVRAVVSSSHFARSLVRRMVIV